MGSGKRGAGIAKLQINNAGRFFLKQEVRYLLKETSDKSEVLKAYLEGRPAIKVIEGHFLDIAKILDSQVFTKDAKYLIDAAGTKKTGKKPGRKIQVDVGKIVSLHNAGWNNAKIADEMGISDVTVGKYINRLLKD